MWGLEMPPSNLGKSHLFSINLALEVDKWVLRKRWQEYLQQCYSSAYCRISVVQIRKPQEYLPLKLKNKSKHKNESQWPFG